MILQILRALFILTMAAVGWFFLSKPLPFGDRNWLTMTVCLVIGTLVICIDILSSRRKLAIFSGTFLGLLVGMLIAYALSFIVALLVDQLGESLAVESRPVVVQFCNLVVGVTCCYLSISFVLQTKDDFRFVIPYVELSKETKGTRPILVDTSVLVDGRIADIAATGILESPLIVPRFVLAELQAIADSADKLKRNRGRRGLDVLAKLRDTRQAQVSVYDSSVHDEAQLTGVDDKLIALAQHLRARVLTTDFNLNKVAQVQGIEVININDLTNALKPVVLPGEKLAVRLVNPGEGDSQAVGYLADGTMVVVEQARRHIGSEVEFQVSRVIQTSAGRMIFGRLTEAPQGN